MRLHLPHSSCSPTLLFSRENCGYLSLPPPWPTLGPSSRSVRDTKILRLAYELGLGGRVGGCCGSPRPPCGGRGSHVTSRDSRQTLEPTGATAASTPRPSGSARGDGSPPTPRQGAPRAPAAGSAQLHILHVPHATCEQHSATRGATCEQRSERHARNTRWRHTSQTLSTLR